MKSIEWVATVETECCQIVLGIQENDVERFEIVGKYGNGDFEKTGRIYDTSDIALESIGMMYGGEHWFLEWIN